MSTLAADEELIEAAQRKAAAERTSLVVMFRQWLAEYVGHERQADKAMAAIREFQDSTCAGGREFSRDKMNEL